MVGIHLFLANDLTPFTGLLRFTSITVFIRTARCLLCKSHSTTRYPLAVGSGKPTWEFVCHSNKYVYLQQEIEDKQAKQRLSPSFTLGCIISNRSDESTILSKSAFLSSGTSLYVSTMKLYNILMSTGTTSLVTWNDGSELTVSEITNTISGISY